jgi:D-alanyl-D-alanine carboxypeptidase (penicillin-binding protein 5/6)
LPRALPRSLLPRCSPPGLAQAPQPPEVAAKSFLVLDLTTNQTLAERNADAAADPASLTKLMTAYVVFEALRDKKLALEQSCRSRPAPGPSARAAAR